jgi:hypothetical protein
MAVVSVDKIWEGRGAKFDAKGTRTYTQCFRVITNDFSDGPQRVASSIGISLSDPYVGDGEADVKALVVSIDPKPENNDPNMWVVTVEYSTATSEEKQNKDQTEDPTQEPPVYSVSFRNVNVPLEIDTQGNWVTNSAGDSFDPPIEVEESVVEITVERNEATLNLTQVYLYQNAVNSDEVVILGTSFGIGQLKMAGITATSADKKGQKYFKYRYVLLARAKKWNPLQILDQGLRFVKGAGLSKCIDGDGNEAQAPMALDGNGGQLGHADVEAGNFQHVEFYPYEEKPFSVLGL